MQLPALCALVLAIFITGTSLAAEPIVLKVAYADSYPPLSSGTDEAVVGLLPARMSDLASELDITLIQKGLPWTRAQEFVRHGVMDVLITSITPDRLSYANASQQPLYRLDFKPYVRKNSLEEKQLLSEESLLKLKDRIYCDVRGNGWGEKFYQALGISYTIVPDFQSCLKLLVNGRVDIIIHASLVIDDLIDSMGLKDQVSALAITMKASPTFHILLSKKSAVDPEILTRIDQKLLAHNSP